MSNGIRAKINKGTVHNIHIHIFDPKTIQGCSVFGDVLEYDKEYEQFNLRLDGGIISILPTKWFTNN